MGVDLPLLGRSGRSNPVHQVLLHLNSKVQASREQENGRRLRLGHCLRVEHLHGLIADAHHRETGGGRSVEDAGGWVEAGQHGSDAFVGVFGKDDGQLGDFCEQPLDMFAVQARFGQADPPLHRPGCELAFVNRCVGG